MELPGLPRKQGLYDPQQEKDSCGIGFVVNIKGQKSHDIVRQGLQVLQNLTHRGAGEYGAGQVFLPPDQVARQQCEKLFAKIIDQEGARLLGWRDVPVKS